MAISRGEEGIVQKIEGNHADAQAEGFIWLGHTWLGLGQPEKATESYEESLRLRRDLGQE